MTYSFSDFGESVPADVNGEQKEDTRRLHGARVTASFFDVLDARPFMGRGFTEREEGSDAASVALISYAPLA